MNNQKIIISIVLIIAVIGGIIYLNSQKVPRGENDGGVTVIPRLSEDSEAKQAVSPEEKTTISKKSSVDEKIASLQKSKKYQLAKEITTPDGFINTDGKPVTIGEFVGKKVALIDFWTYSCINCQRTTPYLNAWYEKYKDKGLVIIGIHTPEFEFEKVYQNVVDATKRLGIKYPVVLDNDYSTWNAYQNRFWPRKYLIDIDGYVMYDHIGEGAYEETEKKIQEALAERMVVLGENGDVNVLVTKELSQVSSAVSPETYFGSLRNNLLYNGPPGIAGEKTFTLPPEFLTSKLYLGGTWNIVPEYAESSFNSKIVYKYNAKEVYVVAEAGVSAKVEVWQDGVLVNTTRGVDVSESGEVSIKESKLYKLIKNNVAGEHTLELRVKDSEVRFYAFTFG